MAEQAVIQADLYLTTSSTVWKRSSPSTWCCSRPRIGLTLDQLKAVPRSIAVAGGTRKLQAIRGALEGRLVKCLITDRNTAEALLAGGRCGFLVAD